MSSLQQGNQLPTQLQNWLNETRAYSQEVSAMLPKSDLGDTFSDDSTTGDLRSPSISDVTQPESRTRDKNPDITRLMDQLEESERDREVLQQEVTILQVKFNDLIRENQQESRPRRNNPHIERLVDNKSYVRKIVDQLEEREREKQAL